jgi:hypothetical protein
MEKQSKAPEEIELAVEPGALSDQLIEAVIEEVIVPAIVPAAPKAETAPAKRGPGAETPAAGRRRKV